MKLSDYLADRQLSDADFAASIDLDRSSVNRMRREKMVPGADVMRRILVATGGAVTPNDFFDVHGAPANSEWPIGSANNGGQIIGSDAAAANGDIGVVTVQEDGHGGPFLPSSPRPASPDAPRASSPLRSSPTCSETSGRRQPSRDRRASSDGEADAA